MTPFEAQAYIIGNIVKTEKIKIPLSKSLGYYAAEPVVSEYGNIILEKGEKIDSRKFFLVSNSGVKDIYVHRKPRILVEISSEDIRKLLMLMLIEEGFELTATKPDFIITSNRPQKARFIVSNVHQKPASNLSFFILENGVRGFFISESIKDVIVSYYIYILPAIRSSFGSSTPYQRKMYLQSANSYNRPLGGKSIFLPVRITDDSLVEILSEDEENYLICDALIHITPEQFSINEEEEVEVYLL